MLIRTIAFTTAMLVPWSAWAQEITGSARAIEGSSLVVGTSYVRLCGVDDPPSGGVRFRRDSQALSDLVAGKSVRCIPLGAGTPCDKLAREQTYQRQIAQCFVGETDLAAALIRSGSACASPAEGGDAYAGLGCTNDRRR